MTCIGNRRREVVIKDLYVLEGMPASPHGNFLYFSQQRTAGHNETLNEGGSV